MNENTKLKYVTAQELEEKLLPLTQHIKNLNHKYETVLSMYQRLETIVRESLLEE